MSREAAGGPDAQIARTRARAGDCAAALGAFDAALRTTIEPTLRRDRGLCHEQLNHPYPAIDDYRAYLTARPDAPDSEQIRQRLARLEEQVGAGGPSPAKENLEAPPPSENKAEAKGSVAIGTGGAKASASTTSSGTAHAGTRSNVLGPKSGEPERSYDYYAGEEKKVDEAESSALRYGHGFIFGPFLSLPRYYIGEGETGDLGYAVGATFRWSTGPSLTLLGDVGYAGIGSQGDNTAQGGALLFAGGELRFPISKLGSDHILARGGLGYEHTVVSGTRVASNRYLARFAAGYRHVFGPSLGLEVLADGGPALVVPDEGSARFVGLIGASVALVIAF